MSTPASLSSERREAAFLDSKLSTTPQESVNHSLAKRPSTRAPLACRNCRIRKVRCIVLVAEMPCANCQRDDEKCVLPERRRGRPRRIQRRKASQAQFPMSPSSSPASEHHPTEAPTKIKPQASSLPAGFNKASQEYADANSKHIDRFGLLRYAHSLNTSLSILHGLEVSFDTTLHKALLWSLIMSLRDDFKNDLTFNNRPGEHVSCPPNKKAQIIPTAGISIPFTDPADEKDSGPYEEEGHASLAGDEADAEWHERTCVDAESPLYRTPESLEDFEIYSTYSQQRQEFEECCELAAFRL